MDEEYWCMQWCGEVLPEPAMIPDLGVFLRSASAHAQVVTTRGAQAVQYHTGARADGREPFAARLKLPFLLAPAGENRALASEQTSVIVAAKSERRTG